MALNVTGGALEFDATINADQFSQQIDNMKGRLKGLTQTANEQTSSIENFAKQAAFAIATYASGAAIGSFVSDVGRVRSQFQQLEVAFNTMLGSKEKAAKLLSEVQNFAAKTPFELTEVAGATKQLLAFGIGADKITETLRSLGDIASGLGQPLGEIAYLYGTIKTAGVANAVDIKQFAQRGIPIYEALAQVLKVNVKEVTNLVSAGKVGFPEIEKAFKALTAEGSKFGGLMEAQSKTLGGLTSNFRDAYDQMLNDIGKSSEGLFATTIKGATFVVENYQKVLDVIKVLVATYGAYKAAVIATNVVNNISVGITKGYTIAEQLRYRAMIISEAAMRLLNKTMLANPFVLVAAGIAALVSSMIIFGKTATQVKTASELLADSQEKFSDRLADTEAKIRPYVERLKDANVTEQERLNIYNKLKDIDPKIVAGLDAKTLSYQNLTDNVNKYLGALRAQIALEANEEAVKASIKQEQSIQKQIDLLNKKKAIADKQAKDARDSEGRGLAQFSAQEAATQIKVLEDQKKAQQDVTEELGKTQVKTETANQEAVKRTVKVIEDEIKALKDKQSANSTTSKEYQDFQKQIEAKERELDAIRGKSKSTIAGENKLETEINSLLNQRKDLLQSIEDLRRGAKQSGLIKEQSELDKINEKYDQAILKITDYNQKVADFNKKNKTNIQGVGLVDINALNAARTEELRNQRLKDDASKFKENLELQKQIFEQYEEAKKNIGVEKADEMFAEQTKGFKSYSEFLKSEFAKQVPKIVLGIANVGDIEKFKTLLKSISDETKRQTEQQIKDYQDLLTQTSDFTDKRGQIDQKYQKLFKTLSDNRKSMTDEEYTRRLESLQTSQDEEINVLKNSIVKQGALYKKLGEDVIRFTKEQLQKRIKELRTVLSTDASLTPQMKADILSAINNLEGLMNATDDTVVHLNKFIEQGSKIKSSLDGLADAVTPFNSAIGEALGTMSKLLSSALNVGQALKDFQVSKNNGDIVGQITSVTNIVTAIITGVKIIMELFNKVKTKIKDAVNEINDFNTSLLTGEQEYQSLLRDRQRQTVLLNKTALDGLKDQQKLLAQQKKENQKAFDDVLSQLQKESFIKGKTLNSNVLNLLFGKDKGSIDVLGTLAGKSFDQLEELFNKGQLTEKAKQLFEALQKIKAEGADIDALLEENKNKVNEIFTGTTSNAIADSILEGFKQGKRSAADFADTFQELMQNALLSAFEAQVIESKINDFYTQFAAAAESPGGLTQAKIDELKKQFNDTIANIGTQFDQLTQITGVNFGQASQSQQQNTLVGSFKSLTEDTGNVLVGQFNGQRVATLQLLDVQKNALGHLNGIEANTANTVIELQKAVKILSDSATGMRPLNVKI
jgi:hypothetical protein